MPDNPADRQHPNDPLHGITLETMLKQLVNKYGWDEIGRASCRERVLTSV